MNRMLALLAIVALGFSAGCSTNGPNSTYEEFGDRINTSGFGHKYPQPEGESELVLGPGDTVGIQIANNPDLSSIQPVRVEGVIAAPWVGDVDVAGLTPSQVRDKLTVLLSPYVRDVSIQVIPLQIISKKIYIYTTGTFGELSGRVLPLQGDFTLIDLISFIGGMNFIADGCHVKVVRGDPRHPKVLNINVTDMIVNGYTAGNIQLQPDDVVFLPPTFIAKVAQTLNNVTLPIRVLSRSLSEAGSAIYFVESGGLPRGRFGRRRGGASAF